MDTVKEVKEVRDLGGTGGAKMEKEYALVQGGGGESRNKLPPIVL